jgi:5-methylcytosine-specific restriction endonuclease McrA
LRLIEQLYRQTGKVAAKNALQRARRLQATPVWVDIEALRSVYVEAKQLSKERSINYHVDHIVPLQHPLVCGLHVPWNLQIITAEQNILKSNNFVPS